MKNFIFSILIAFIAVVVSAFINTEKVNAEKVNGRKTNRFAVTYYHHCPGVYNLTPGSTCIISLTSACRITYPTSQGSSFSDTAIPSGGTESAEKGCYQ